MTAQSSTVAPSALRRSHGSSGNRPSARKVLRRTGRNTAVALLLLIEIGPLVWLVIGSLKTQRDWMDRPTWALPSSLAWENYTQAWTTGNLAEYLKNSVIAVAPSLAMVIVFGVTAGFALEIFVWRGRATVLLYFLAGVMVPGQMILLPLFNAYFRAGLTGSLWPLIITYTATGLPLTVFLMATYFRSLPREVFEAAVLDGAGVMRTFFSVAVPMVRNAIFTVALIQFFFLWNDLLIALTFTTDSSLRTVQVGLLNFTGEFGATQYGPLFAAICINVLGLLGIYIFLNKKVMAGLTSGAVKG